MYFPYPCYVQCLFLFANFIIKNSVISFEMAFLGLFVQLQFCDKTQNVVTAKRKEILSSPPASPWYTLGASSGPKPCNPQTSTFESYIFLLSLSYSENSSISYNIPPGPGLENGQAWEAISRLFMLPEASAQTCKQICILEKECCCHVHVVPSVGNAFPLC